MVTLEFRRVSRRTQRGRPMEGKKSRRREGTGGSRASVQTSTWSSSLATSVRSVSLLSNCRIITVRAARESVGRPWGTPRSVYIYPRVSASSQAFLLARPTGGDEPTRGNRPRREKRGRSELRKSQPHYASIRARSFGLCAVLSSAERQRLTDGTFYNRYFNFPLEVSILDFRATIQ